jgi:hypothetical protein
LMLRWSQWLDSGGWKYFYGAGLLYFVYLAASGWY